VAYSALNKPQIYGGPAKLHCYPFFTNRAVNNWNSLPSHVLHADTVNSLYDYHAEIHGTGSRSEARTKFLL